MNNKQGVDMSKIGALIVAAIGDMQAVEKKAVNPFYKSKYATLDDILIMSKPILKKHGLSLLSTPNIKDGKMVIEFTFVSGEETMTAGVYPVIAKKDDDPQEVGKAVTYARRYGTSLILNIANDDDDDGNVAAGKVEAEKKEKVETLDDLLIRINKAKLALAGEFNEVLNAEGYEKVSQIDNIQKAKSFLAQLNKHSREKQGK
jgi:hypothetical protein